MKKGFILMAMVTVLLLVAGEAALADVAITDTNFPDENFRTYVSTYIDRDNDGLLSSEEMSNTKSILVNNHDIQTLEGIRFFTGITTLSCSYNSISSLDLSDLTSLTYLECENNKLTTLDVRACPELQSLYCGYNSSLTELKADDLGKLTTLNCAYSSIESLSFEGCSALTELNCSWNEIIRLDVSECARLEKLDCAGDHLFSLDVSQCPSLTQLKCAFTLLRELDLTKNTALLEEIRKCEVYKNGNAITVGTRRVSPYGSEYYSPLALTVNASVTVLPEGTISLIPPADFALPEGLKRIESESFLGIVDKVCQIPESVTYIAQDAFEETISVIVVSGSYAEERAKELGLTVYVQ